MYPPGGPFDWEEYMRQQQRAALAAGGVPPAEPPPAQPPVEEPDPIETEPYAPTQAQKTAKEVFGIGSTGPLAERAVQGVDDYNARREESFNTLGQHEPQQFGKIEGTFLAEGPLKPRDAVEAFMAKKTPDEIAHYSKLKAKPKIVSPQEQLAKNQAYDAKVQSDRMAREEQRDRQRNQGYLNRAAARDKTADMWEQFRMLNGIQGGGMMGVRRGPVAQNVGGALLIEGLGREPEYIMPGYGRGYGGRMRSPEELDLERQELERRKAKDAADAALGNRRATNAEKGTELRREAMKQATEATMWMQRFRQSGLEEDRREAVTSGTNAVAALAADLQRRQAYAKQNVGTFFGPEEGELRDIVFDEAGKPGKPSKGEYRKRIDVLRNQLRSLKQADPTNSWAAGLSEETLEAIRAALAEFPEAAAANVP